MFPGPRQAAAIRSCDQPPGLKRAPSGVLIPENYGNGASAGLLMEKKPLQRERRGVLCESTRAIVCFVVFQLLAQRYDVAREESGCNGQIADTRTAGHTQDAEDRTAAPGHDGKGGVVQQDICVLRCFSASYALSGTAL